MLLLAADENLNNKLVRGVQRLHLQLDIVRVQDAGLRGADGCRRACRCPACSRSEPVSRLPSPSRRSCYWSNAASTVSGKVRCVTCRCNETLAHCSWTAPSAGQVASARRCRVSGTRARGGSRRSSRPRTRTRRTRAEVAAKLAEVAQRVASGAVLLPTRSPTLSEYLDYWMTQVVEPALRPTSVSKYGPRSSCTCGQVSGISGSTSSPSPRSSSSSTRAGQRVTRCQSCG